MAQRTINYDRPCIIKMVPDIGMEIFMYKDNPGVYLTAYGSEVPLALAEKAGYDVQRLGKLRQRKLNVETAIALAHKQAEADEVDRNVIADFSGFKVISIGLGRHLVEDRDGNVITPHVHLSKEMAIGIAKGMEEQNSTEAPPAVVGDLGHDGLGMDAGGKPANGSPRKGK